MKEVAEILGVKGDEFGFKVMLTLAFALARRANPAEAVGSEALMNVAECDADAFIAKIEAMSVHQLKKNSET